ncbi:MAG: dual specificity protein phosphatase family protein [Deltaproteobacteria bacterium]|nr:dual specificity protein phosphatase family protein [Deltaproteobacteria bacterium]
MEPVKKPDAPPTAKPPATAPEQEEAPKAATDQFVKGAAKVPGGGQAKTPAKPGGKKIFGFTLDLPPRQFETMKAVSLAPVVEGAEAGGGAAASALATEALPGIVSQVADTNVYVGSLNDAANIDALKASEFTHVLNLARESDGSVARNPNDLKAAGIQERRIRLRDNMDAEEDFKAYLPHALEFIDNARQGGGNVLIHCQKGVSRSVSVAIADRMRQLAEKFGKDSAMLAKHLLIFITKHLQKFKVHAAKSVWKQCRI